MLGCGGGGLTASVPTAPSITNTAPILFSNHIFGAFAFSSGYPDTGPGPGHGQNQCHHPFVVLCGISDVPSPRACSITKGSGVDMHAYVSYGWWQDASSTVFCLAMSWEMLAVETGTEPDEPMPELNQRTLLELARIYSTTSRVVAGAATALSAVSRLNEPYGRTIIARIEKMDFLDRKAIRVSVGEYIGAP
jgi:hypothetical protein